MHANRKKGTSIKDIATAVGVSTAAVSFVLTGQQKKYRVSDAVAEKIKETAKQMGYTPNEFARSLRKGTSHTIGVIVSDISNQFFADIVRHIESTAEQHGYMALFASSDENSVNMANLVNKMLSKEVDGLILVPCKGSEATIGMLLEKGVPTVLIDRYIPTLKTSYVALDNFQSAYNATKHLIDEGFTHIAMISYKTDLINISRREDGYRQALKDAGMEDATLIKSVSIKDIERGCKKEMKCIMEAGADAILFATNSITIQCLHYIQQNGIRIPDDLGLVGFDGGSVFDFFYSPLTYVNQPLERMSRKSVEVLIEMMESGSGILQQIEADGTLVVRNSSRKKNKQ